MFSSLGMVKTGGQWMTKSMVLGIRKFPAWFNIICTIRRLASQAQTPRGGFTSSGSADGHEMERFKRIHMNRNGDCQVREFREGT